ncbi:hypothetical protein MY11210_009674 [Beauveria gryllotalpidicola]
MTDHPIDYIRNARPHAGGEQLQVRYQGLDHTYDQWLYARELGDRAADLIQAWARDKQTHEVTTDQRRSEGQTLRESRAAHSLDANDTVLDINHAIADEQPFKHPFPMFRGTQDGGDTANQVPPARPVSLRRPRLELSRQPCLGQPCLGRHQRLGHLGPLLGAFLAIPWGHRTRRPVASLVPSQASRATTDQDASHVGGHAAGREHQEAEDQQENRWPGQAATPTSSAQDHIGQLSPGSRSAHARVHSDEASDSPSLGHN